MTAFYYNHPASRFHYAPQITILGLGTHVGETNSLHQGKLKKSRLVKKVVRIEDVLGKVSLKMKPLNYSMHIFRHIMPSSKITSTEGFSTQLNVTLDDGI